MSFFGSKTKSKPGETLSVTTPTPKRSGQSAIESVIGANTQIKGDILGDGGLRVDGVVAGKIELTGNLVITESAKVRAEIKANNISVSGAVHGNITATRIEILDTGRVWGDLTVKSLLVNEGAYFRGQTMMPQDLKPPQLELPKPSESPEPGNVVDIEPEES
jgi:cytoskeletal protein CcmA (bactofilin family)